LSPIRRGFPGNAQNRLFSVEALVDGHSPEHLADGFVGWLSEAHWSTRGSVFDVGNATRTAIRRLAAGTSPEVAGGTAPDDNRNGSLMRILPVALPFAGGKPDRIAPIAARASRLTRSLLLRSPSLPSTNLSLTM
jgi:ADP-ribosylglycohydrolase